MLHIFAKNMEIYNKLRILRQSKGYTQDYIAEKLNIDPVNYGRIERGQTKLTIERLQKLANIFDISIVDFFEKETPTSVPQIETILDKIYQTELEILQYLKNKNN